jgi:hypothetical protein
MNWKLTLTKGVVVGALAMLAVTLADIQAINVWWAGGAALLVEAVRDIIKQAFGKFAEA